MLGWRLQCVSPAAAVGWSEPANANWTPSSDEIDFEWHVGTLHFNPVKHGWVPQAVDWPHASIHRYLRQARALEFTMFTPTYRAGAARATTQGRLANG